MSADILSQVSLLSSFNHLRCMIHEGYCLTMKWLLKKLMVLLAVILFLSSTMVGQSLTWQQSQPYEGIEWLHFQGKLNQVNQWINVLLIDTNLYRLRVAHDGKRLKPLSCWADSAGAIAAINGNFFHTLEGGSVCFTRIDGNTTDTSRTDLPARWFLPELDDGALVARVGGWTILPTPEKGWGSTAFRTVFAAGPLLISNGKLVSLPDYSFSNKRYGRSAVGFRPDGVMVWVAVSGIEPASSGFSLSELQQVMLNLGCSDALNLDGGSSTSLWLRNGVPNRVVSVPYKVVAVERAVANALFVTPK